MEGVEDFIVLGTASTNEIGTCQVRLQSFNLKCCSSQEEAQELAATINGMTFTCKSCKHGITVGDNQVACISHPSHGYLTYERDSNTRMDFEFSDSMKCWSCCKKDYDCKGCIASRHSF